MYLNRLQPTTEAKTMIRLKMFVRHSLDQLEEEVNEWIEQENIMVRHVTQSQCEKQGRFVFVMSLFYEASEN